jgi:hypothetical protein
MIRIETFISHLFAHRGEYLAKFCRNPSSFDRLQTIHSKIRLLLSKALVVTQATQKCLFALTFRVLKTLQTTHPKKLTGTNAGCGGNYLIKERRGAPVAIFKPHDEEPFGVNSQVCFPRFDGIREGEGAINECAAFLLDKDHFYGVMPTTLTLLCSGMFFSKTACTQPIVKIGSLQAWVQHTHVSWEQKTDRQKSQYPQDQIHKIAILDIRIHNLDRRPANVLCEKSRLIPIDHGPTFPTSLEPKCNWSWMHSTQAKMKLSPKCLAHIASLTPEEDATLLRQKLGMRRKALFMMRINTEFLKIAALNNLTPFEMGRYAGALEFTQESNPLSVVHQQIMEQLALRYSVQPPEFRPWRNAKQTKAYFVALKQQLGVSLYKPRL